MEELSIEQKAKAYDEAIKKAESLYKVSEPMSGCNVIIETLFPELKESEDERIRKALINGFNKFDKSAVWYNGITNAQILDWLEKQGEHANFRNKIQIGDKVTRNRDGYLVNLSQLNRVAKKDEKQGEQKPTNEEMKTLLQTEYEKGRADAIAEQKSWSEEDEKVLHAIRNALNYEKPRNYLKSRDFEFTDILDWLKSLKDRVQPKQEWGEDDKAKIVKLKSFIAQCNGFNKENRKKAFDLIDSINPQTTWKPSDEQFRTLDNIRKYLADGSGYWNEFLKDFINDLKKL